MIKHFPERNFLSGNNSSKERYKELPEENEPD
jgi:hypothetical protein